MKFNKIDSDLSLLWLKANVSLYHVTKFSLYFSLTVSYFCKKDKSFMPVLFIRVVLEYFYLLYVLFLKILNLNLTFAISRRRDSKSL